MEQEIEGSVKLIDKQSTTFGTLAMQSYDPASGVAAHDWFNAVVAQLEGSARLEGGLYSSMYANWDISKDLLQWYEYKITLAPGEHAVNTVTAPIYPIANTKFSPAIYTYEYFCAGMTTAEGFEGIEVFVNTPYCLIREQLGGMFMYETGYLSRDYETTDSGYRYLLDNSEYGNGITFTLSTSEDLTFHSGLEDILIFLLFAAFVQYIVYPIIIITLSIIVVKMIVKAVRKRRAKKQDGDDQQNVN